MGSLREVQSAHRHGSGGQRTNILDVDSMQAQESKAKGPSRWRATRCLSHFRPGSGLGNGVEVGGRKNEQEAERDEQARAHDLVNTSAQMPANAKNRQGRFTLFSRSAVWFLVPLH